MDDDGFCVHGVMKRENFAYHDCGDDDGDGDVTVESQIHSQNEIGLVPNSQRQEEGTHQTVDDDGDDEGDNYRDHLSSFPSSLL